MQSVFSNDLILLTCGGGQIGGTELRMMAEGELLRELGYDAQVALSDFPRKSAFEEMLAAAGVPSFDFNPPPLMNDWQWRHLHWLKAELFTRRRLIRRHPRLMHVYFPWTNQGLDHLWLAGRCGIPTIVSVHNTFPQTDWGDWYRRRLHTAFGHVRGVYGVSESAIENFVAIFADFLPETAIQRVIYNFADTERFQPSRVRRDRTRQRLGLRPETPLIGSVGRLDKQKEPLSLLSVFAKVKDQRPDAHLLLIGEGHLESAVRQRIVELDISDNVTLLPFQHNVEEVFPALDVHLLMSRREGFGIVTAEAMACGVPVVASAVTGTEEVARGCQAAKLVPFGDEGAAAGAILDIISLDEAARDRLAQAARAHIAEKFSKDIWRQRIAAFYETVLE